MVEFSQQHLNQCKCTSIPTDSLFQSDSPSKSVQISIVEVKSIVLLWLMACKAIQ